MEAGNVRREREGVRLTWKVPAEPKLAQLWNPWSKEIPWLIFVSHPLLSCRSEYGLAQATCTYISSDFRF